MEEVDHIILHSLSGIGVKFPETVRSLADFPGECFLPALKKCLDFISGVIAEPDVRSVPENVSEKVMLADSIVSELKALGCEENVECRQIMYPDEGVARKTFTFLIGKMSKRSSVESRPAPRDGASFVMRNICERIASDLISPRLSCGAIEPKTAVVEKSSRSADATEDFPIDADDFRETVDVDGIVERMRSHPPDYSAWARCARAGRSRRARSDGRGVPDVERDVRAVRRKKEELLAALHSERKALAELKDRLDTSSLASNLMSDDESNALKLLSIAERERDKIEFVRREIEAKLKTKNDADGDLEIVENRSTMAKNDLRNTREKFENLRDELEFKRRVVEHSKAELENKRNQMIKVKDRRSYTEKIMDILAHIGKQKVEVNKILSDTRSVQKEMGQVYGKFERSFMVVDEIIFQDAKRDEFARKLYKTVAEAREMCDRISGKIEEYGARSGDVRSLTNAVEKERKKNIVENIEKANRDLSGSFTDPLRGTR